MSKSYIIYACFILIIGLCFGAIACGLEKDSNAENIKLTTRYCARCHHLPDPQSLTKDVWERSIMPKMSKYFIWSGESKFSYAKRSIYNETGTIPMTDELWTSLMDHYVNNGIEEVSELVHEDLAEQSFFEVKTINDYCNGRGISAVAIDQFNSSFLVACDSTISKITPSGAVVNSTMTDGLISGIFPSDKSSAWVTDPRFLDPHNMTLGKLKKWNYLSDELIVIKENLARPVYLTRSEDKLFISEFGNLEGQLSEMNIDGSGQKTAHNLPGGYRSIIFDFDQDGKDEILTLFAQALEGVYVREVDATDKRFVPVVSFTPEWGISDMDTADVNRDGWTDLIIVNGDNADYSPISKAYHGVRVYLNNKNGRFEEAYTFPLHGATQVQSLDANGDGRMDLLVASFFAIDDSNNLILLIDDGVEGEISYTPYQVSESNEGRWMVMDAGDVDGDGDTDAILGSFKNVNYDQPQKEKEGAATDILLLLNQSIK